VSLSLFNGAIIHEPRNKSSRKLYNIAKIMLDFSASYDIMVLHWKTEIPEAHPLAINPESA
jgi:hypothetical protein